MADSRRIDGTSRTELTSDAQRFYENYWVEGASAASASFERLRLLLDAFCPSLPSEQRILEIGVGGEGGLIRLLKDTNSVAGVDASSGAVEVCRRGGLDVTLLTADRDPLPFAADSFDIVFACEVFEHFANPQYALEQIQRVLKPRGFLGLTTPHPLMHHWPRLFYPTLLERQAFREFLTVNRMLVRRELRFGEHPFQARDSSPDACWSWIWCAENVKSGDPAALFASGMYFLEKRDESGLRRTAIEAADLFRACIKEDPTHVEAAYALALALCYRVLNGEREEFQEHWAALERDAADISSGRAPLAQRYRALVVEELRNMEHCLALKSQTDRIRE